MFASILDRFRFFPISKDQLIMLLEGNVCDSEEIFKLFKIDVPIDFNLESLSYLSKENE